MSENAKQGLQKRRTLNEEELAEIIELKALCDRHDNLHMRISLDELRQRSGKENDDFLYYEQGRLIGYLYIDSWGQKEKEVTGMVNPEFRRRGIFRQLFEAASADCKQRGVARIVLVGEHSSHTAHAFAKAVSAHRDFSEHEMVLRTLIERGRTDPQLQIRVATVEDKPAIVSIIATDLQGDEDDARELVNEFYATPNCQIFLATFAGQPLGCLRLDYGSESMGIYGFVVRPEYRGHGYGRQMLEYTINQISDRASRTVMLEVETENHRAIGLYKSCGFQITTTYDYFNKPLHSL